MDSSNTISPNFIKMLTLNTNLASSGSSSLPIYINSSGVAAAISSLSLSGTIKATGSNRVYAGDNIYMCTDSEGGNLRITAPDSYNRYWEVDAHNGNLRAYCSDNGTIYSPISITTSGITVSSTVTATTFSGSLSGNATTATTATKLGSSTVGSSTKPIYLNAGTATACSYDLGTLSSSIDTLNTNYTNGTIQVTNYSSFDELWSGITGIGNGTYFNIVSYSSTTDSSAPITTSGTWWWNVITIMYAQTRVTQIAFSVFNYRKYIYLRQKHDSAWTGWYSFTGTDV